MYLLSPESLLFVVQNLFLYGYGAIFNFLGIVITAMFKGMDIKYGSLSYFRIMPLLGAHKYYLEVLFIPILLPLLY